MAAQGPFRLSKGGMVDRQRLLHFRLNGKELTGFAGDTLASALLANGVRSVGRSFKFHRPRGVYSCGSEEPNALVQLGSGARTLLSVRSTLIDLQDGLEVFSPHLKFDLGRVLDFTAPLWAAGFYNKTFIWPSWHMHEWYIRRMTGSGHVPPAADPDRYEIQNLHCDVLVIGGGVAGLSAADAAADDGSRLVLVEGGTQLGGRTLWDGSVVDGVTGSKWVSDTSTRLRRRANVRILERTIAIGYYDHDVVTLLESVPQDQLQRRTPRERYWVVRAGRVVLASGAIEQPLIFCNNDRPGILLACAAHQYLRRYGVAVGRRVLVATNNDSAYPLARDLWQAGIEVIGVADTRHDVPSNPAEGLRALSIPVWAGSIPVNSRGFGALSSVTIGRLSPDSTAIESKWQVACDAMAISGGWNPALHLYSQAGGKLTYDDSSGSLVPITSGAFWPATRHPSIEVVGAALDTIRMGPRIAPVGDTRRQWVDLRHDVTVADLELAVREGYASIEHVKRYTTVGMAADQGKTSNVATLEIVARLRGVRSSDVGHTTLRPPFMPVTLGAIAGRAIGEQFAPSRRLPMHEWHRAHDGVVEDYGEWKRPAVYLKSGELRDDAIHREARTVRNAAGIFDGSSLGKIEVQGPDALEFLDRFYINNLKTLKPGRLRYGIMLREAGTIFDDGTVAMLTPDHLLITTTSGNAGRVAAWLEEWHQCEWPNLRLAILPVTDQWATVSLAGPHARTILSRLGTDIDLSNAAFPHLEMRAGRLLGHQARIYRVSFTGELTYEINIPACAGPEVWDALLNAGEPNGLQPFGLEALLLMRLEKGFLHIGTDTDGTTVPDDVGWGELAARKSADFIGKRSLALPEHVRTDRLQLIGLVGDTDIVIGSHLRLADSREPTDGWVTSAGRAVLLGKPIALAVLRSGRQHVGARVSVHDMGNTTHARVVRPPFFDPAGERMNV
jgi:sarcosine oxidase subunit alpha